MNADLLRRAAALMRERAKATVSPSAWRSDEQEVLGPEFVDGTMRGVAEVLYEEDAEHIASWHPAVALAVADWLDDSAADAEGIPDEECNPYALAVASAYLGAVES